MSKKKSSFMSLICLLFVTSMMLLLTDSLNMVRADEEMTTLYLPLITKPMSYQIIKDRLLWESSVSGNILTEDFEKDLADWGTLAFPYETGNGFVLTGESSAQIIWSDTLLTSGNIIHFRDWDEGLTFWFPGGTSVQAFGFDYRASEQWYLTFNDVETISLPPSRPSFVGIEFYSEYPSKFVLWSDSYAQGGLTVDNISYIPVEIP
ncbi:MAG: hypothetical protein IAF02_00680 [Anaerolineae bacterium]|nr:hypothetical protein [Anaerolineae bacterium]